jgi:hypothetical protein
MSARRLTSGVWGAAAVIALCCAPARVSAQEEPTPFWLPSTPDSGKKAADKKKPAKPSSAPKKPSRDAGKASKPASNPSSRPAAKPAEPAEEPGYQVLDAPEPPARKPSGTTTTTRKREPLPPIPRLEPEMPATPPPSRSTTTTAQPPADPPPLLPAPLRPGEHPAQRAPIVDVPPPQAASAPKPPPTEPARTVTATPSDPAANASLVTPIREAPASPPRTTRTPVSVEQRRRWSVLAFGGMWGKGGADATRAWQLAYGLTAGYEILKGALQLDLLAARAGGSAGNLVTSVTTAHNLVALRAFGVLGSARYAALIGGGAGVALAQTSYSLQELGGTARSLSATSGKLAWQVAAGARARPWRGLELRAEVSGMLRDGKIDFLPIFGAGLAF